MLTAEDYDHLFVIRDEERELDVSDFPHPLITFDFDTEGELYCIVGAGRASATLREIWDSDEHKELKTLANALMEALDVDAEEYWSERLRSL